MSFEKAFAFLNGRGFRNRVKRFSVSSATVELAAKAVGTEPARIAKSLTFLVDGGPVMILCAGDVKIANPKFKEFFQQKAKMLTPEQALEMTGHAVGGVCPFGIPETVKVYLDESLKRFEYVYPACGDAASAVELTCGELEALSGGTWANLCTPMIPRE